MCIYLHTGFNLGSCIKLVNFAWMSIPSTETRWHYRRFKLVNDVRMKGAIICWLSE